jgi:hypothetical protein
MVKFIVFYYQENFHDGGSDSKEIVHAKNAEIALIKIKKRLDEWIESFPQPKQAKYRNIRVYKISDKPDASFVGTVVAKGRVKP